MKRSDAKVVALIQARMESTRLPGKVLRELHGRPVLDWVVRAARAAAEVDEVVVATSTSPADDAVVEYAERAGVRVHRGSQDDVLDRFVTALDLTGADAVVRLTADCPLLDPAVIDTTVATWRAVGVDYVSTILFRTLPRGLDVECIGSDALRTAHARARDHHRVHVTSYVYTHPEEFSLLGLVFGAVASTARVTLDTPEDAVVLDAITAGLGDAPPAWSDVVAWLSAHPDVALTNAAVVQKALEQG